jgi:hypothetical protein
MIKHDPEILALGQVFESLKGLNKAEISRIIRWAGDRFSREEYVPAPVSDVETEMVAPADEDIEERGKATKKDLTDYESIADLFAAANLKRATAKIILMAAYMQERLNFKEMTSQDITNRLKRVDKSIRNVSVSISNILLKKPPVMIAIKKEGDAMQGRRKFRVTNEGVALARKYLEDAQ